MALPMRRLGGGIVLSAGIAGAILACGAARLPAPPYVGQTTEALQPAAYPPPPARVELVPDSPRPEAVWLDGEWTWQGRRWAWKRGRWVAPPANARYAPWTSVRDALGTFYIAEGRWRDEDGGELPDPQPLAVAVARAGAVVTPEGEAVPQTPNVRADASRSGSSTDRQAEVGPAETPSGATLTGTEPKTGAEHLPEGGVPPDAGLQDVSGDATEPTDAMPLGASSPRMVPP